MKLKSPFRTIIDLEKVTLNVVVVKQETVF